MSCLAGIETYIKVITSDRTCHYYCFIIMLQRTLSLSRNTALGYLPNTTAHGLSKQRVADGANPPRQWRESSYFSWPRNAPRFVIWELNWLNVEDKVPHLVSDDIDMYNDDDKKSPRT